MKISRERLIDELALKNVEVRELRDEVASLKKELASYSKERRIIAERNSAKSRCTLVVGCPAVSEKS